MLSRWRSSDIPKYNSNGQIKPCKNNSLRPCIWPCLTETLIDQNFDPKPAKLGRVSLKLLTVFLGFFCQYQFWATSISALQHSSLSFFLDFCFSSSYQFGDIRLLIGQNYIFTVFYIKKYYKTLLFLSLLIL